jgi:hypothetical protein
MAVILFALRREPLTHKLRYSKTIKGDFAAAFLGAVIGLFAGYLTLSSLGGSAIDLADLTTLAAYLIVALCIWYNANAVLISPFKAVKPSLNSAMSL